MILGIIMIFNVIIGYILREYTFKCKNQIRPEDYIGFRRFLRYTSIILVAVSYMLQIIFIFMEEYKFALCMLLICVSVFHALNQIVYSKKD